MLGRRRMLLVRRRSNRAGRRRPGRAPAHCEVVPSPGQQRLDRLWAHLHRFGDVGVAHFFELAEQHGHPLPLVETRQGGLDDVAQLGLVELPGGHLPAGRLGQVVEPRCAIGPTALGAEIDFRPPGERTQRVRGDVVGDRVEPGRELGAGHVPLPGPIDPQEDFLRQILSQMASAHEVFQDRDQAILVADHQLVEGGGVVVAHRQHQPHVRILQLVAPGRGFADCQRLTSPGGTAREKPSLSVYHAKDGSPREGKSSARGGTIRPQMTLLTAGCDAVGGQEGQKLRYAATHRHAKPRVPGKRRFPSAVGRPTDNRSTIGPLTQMNADERDNQKGSAEPIRDCSRPILIDILGRSRGYCSDLHVSCPSAFICVEGSAIPRLLACRPAAVRLGGSEQSQYP